MTNCGGYKVDLLGDGSGDINFSFPQNLLYGGQITFYRGGVQVNNDCSFNVYANLRQLMRPLFAAFLFGAWVLLSQPTFATSAQRTGAEMGLPRFTEVTDQVARESGSRKRVFKVVFPGFAVTGTFKSITVRKGRLAMVPADGEQLFFQPTETPTQSRVYLAEDGLIAPELLAKP